jgi:hypothetical protein
MRWILPTTVLLIWTKPGLSNALPGTVSSGIDVKSASATNAVEEKSSVITVPAMKIQFNCDGGVDGPDGFEENFCCQVLNFEGTWCSCTTVNMCDAQGGTPGYECQGDSPGNTCSRPGDEKQLDNGPFADDQRVMQQKEGSHRPGGR